jgi:hypothetical protein
MHDDMCTVRFARMHAQMCGLTFKKGKPDIKCSQRRRHFTTFLDVSASHRTSRVRYPPRSPQHPDLYLFRIYFSSLHHSPLPVIDFPIDIHAERRPGHLRNANNQKDRLQDGELRWHLSFILS